MKKTIFLTILFLIQLSLFSQDKGDIPSGINLALKEGNAKDLSNYMNNNVEMVIIDKEGIYNKVQAEMILKDFFAKNPPRKFSLLHQGGKADSKYGIGNLITSDNTYRVYFLLKITNGKSLIHQFRIEKEND